MVPPKLCVHASLSPETPAQDLGGLVATLELQLQAVALKQPRDISDEGGGAVRMCNPRIKALGSQSQAGASLRTRSWPLRHLTFSSCQQA